VQKLLQFMAKGQEHDTSPKSRAFQDHVCWLLAVGLQARLAAQQQLEKERPKWQGERDALVQKLGVQQASAELQVRHGATAHAVCLVIALLFLLCKLPLAAEDCRHGDRLHTFTLQLLSFCAMLLFLSAQAAECTAPLSS
jgi:hypothetical protein